MGTSGRPSAIPTIAPKHSSSLDVHVDLPSGAGRHTSSPCMVVSKNSRRQIISFKPLAVTPGNRSIPVLTLFVNPLLRLGNRLFHIAMLISVAIEAAGSLCIALPREIGSTGGLGTILRKLDRVLVESSSLPTFTNPSMCELLELKNPSMESPYLSRTVDSMVLGQTGNWALQLTKMLRRTSVSRNAAPCEVLRLRGLFIHYRYIREHLEGLRRLFWDKDSVQKAAAMINDFVPNTENVVSIHFRLGDYLNFRRGGSKNRFLMYDSYYRNASAYLQHRLGSSLTCLIFSDTPDVAERKSQRIDSCGRKIIVPGTVDLITSFYMMSLTPHSIISDSTYSYWAALLGDRKSNVIFPLLSVDAWAWMRVMTSTPGWVGLPARLI